MKLRPPSVPLITIDPFFSVWSAANNLYDNNTVHWTGKPNTICGTVTIDGEEFRFMGSGNQPVIPQISIDCNALSTKYVFKNEKIRLDAIFTSPLLPDDLDILSRPVSYLKLSATATDGKKHDVAVNICATEELCLNTAGQAEVICEKVEIKDVACVRMGNKTQNILNKAGDDHRIDWGYFYLAVCGENQTASFSKNGVSSLCVSADLCDDVLVLFAYDDVKSINYFGEYLPSYWNRNGKTIEQAISDALYSYEETYLNCEEFSEGLFLDGVRAGGKKYAEMLELAYRQSVAAHKVAYTNDGEILFISKECFSNGCAATVDVSYPSIPLYLIYNPELVRGMMRPVYKFAASKDWEFDFAPHDAGRYPFVTGQVYGLQKNGENVYNLETPVKYGQTNDGNLAFNMQMPVEECGNMLIMEAATLLADRNTDFVLEHMDVLESWVKYLIKYGYDPENQLCTDDFAGHLAHNCNLTLKAIMGIASFAIINKILGKKQICNEYMNEAKKMAQSWCKRAANGDGSYKLAFDRPGTFSMKYNAVWDKIFGTKLFPEEVIASELFSNFKHINAYGMPLDSRSDYTKADWLVWTATMLDDDDDFERFVKPLWDAYNSTEDRVPMTDWYFTTTAKMRGFQNRTVIGGLFIKVLRYLGKLDIENI